MKSIEKLDWTKASEVDNEGDVKQKILHAQLVNLGPPVQVVPDVKFFECLQAWFSFALRNKVVQAEEGKISDLPGEDILKMVTAGKSAAISLAILAVLGLVFGLIVSLAGR